MNKIMICQRMRGLSDEAILIKRDKVIQECESKGWEVCNPMMEYYDAFEDNPLYLIGKCLEIMSVSNAVYFLDGWKESRGCIVEHEAAMQYGIKIFYEGDLTCLNQ